MKVVYSNVHLQTFTLVNVIALTNATYRLDAPLEMLERAPDFPGPSEGNGTLLLAPPARRGRV